MATNTPPDYSKAIVIPREIPEHLESHFAALKKARKVIKILSMFTQGVETFPYTIQNGGNEERLTLPRRYEFDGFELRFLPGWWAYCIILDDGVEFSIRLPRGRDQFEEDLEIITHFVKTYKGLPRFEAPYKEPKASIGGSSYENYMRSHPPLSKRQQAVIYFRNELQTLGRWFYPSKQTSKKNKQD